MKLDPRRAVAALPSERVELEKRNIRPVIGKLEVPVPNPHVEPKIAHGRASTFRLELGFERSAFKRVHEDRALVDALFDFRNFLVGPFLYGRYLILCTFNAATVEPYRSLYGTHRWFRRLFHFVIILKLLLGPKIRYMK